MTDLLFSLEVAVGLVVAIAGGYLLAMFMRRRAISRGNLVTLCAFQREGSHAWRQGFIRFGESELEWFPLSGLTMNARHRWSRRDLELGVPVDAASREAPASIPDAVCVTCVHVGERFGLALPLAAYTALRSWVEAAPPESASAVN